MYAQVCSGNWMQPGVHVNDGCAMCAGTWKSWAASSSGAGELGINFTWWTQ